MSKTIKIRDIATGVVKDWALEEVLTEINRDHSDQWG